MSSNRREADSGTLLLTVVGSGTLLPHPERGSASFHVETAGHRLLLDAGPGTLHGLPRAGVDWRSIDTIALTHFHPDHVSDLPALLAAYRYEAIEQPLTLLGPRGLRGYLDRLAALHGAWILAPSRPTRVVELMEGEAWWSDGGAVGLRSATTHHTDESVAYRVTAGARAPSDGLDSPSDAPAVLGYTGDTGPNTELHDFLRGATVLLAECALTDPPEIDTHLSPRSVAELAEAVDPELLLISHVYPPQTPEEAVDAVRRRYPGRVRSALDGLRVRLSGAGATVDPPAGRP